MLIRRDPNSDGGTVTLITQPAHAAISAQLARAWGNPRVGAVEPRDDVCDGALLHDIGWIDWERTPTLNRVTGLPHSFIELGTRDHLGIWESAAGRALAFGRYPALLTSMHFTGLYEQYHDYSRDSDDEARDARALVGRELAFQQRLIASLRAESVSSQFADDQTLRRNRRLIALWDGMSLALCHGLREPRTLRGVPAQQGHIDLVLSPTEGGISVEPWPFSVDRVSVSCDGRMVTGTYLEQTALDDALQTARWVAVEATLLPAR
ncbi:MAG: DUF3891 family protein [Thermomicrobiales bacterium]